MRIQIFPLTYEGEKRIGIRPLGFDKAFPGQMKQIPGSRWTPGERCWHIPYSKEAYRQLLGLFGKANLVKLTQSPEKPSPKPAAEKAQVLLKYGDELTRMEQQLRVQRYSWNTIKTYKHFFALLLAYYPGRAPSSLEKQDILTFLLKSSEEKNWSSSTQNQAVNAVKFYYEKVLGQQRTFYDLRPRKGRPLPNVFSESEIERLLSSVKNVKHRTILMLIYSGGLRIGESIPTTKWFGTPNHFESSIYSREKVGQSPNLFGSGILDYERRTYPLTGRQSSSRAGKGRKTGIPCFRIL